ncbi:uncharacterized protein AMSG_06588 [Thecamonas trahens ATCC 50062]|uniref:ER membrane protein complex subunit 7 beta-sandwich domain-containing protein n=1 Tax=Thecamonas trahens ATCC 50062 TaxID=461836 RepID=A0A0L0DGC2_THETB|nr:hypothetical protein AMSG_06588 [Thecamonas trahens ATCC 50062]KNC51230.1 hypothetical protein AMSG_06588 [Thecamonas trahens ATCC 50062]|eukprot:XP_013756424.1 hypothetical protein AMSG_06588 [Thecamonas trahens ATCC 50062]
MLHGQEPSLNQVAVPDASGRFVFDGIPEVNSQYRVDVVSMEYEFMAARVIVSPGKKPMMRAKAANDSTIRLAYPLVLKPIAPAVFLTEPQTTSILSMVLGNPMILMMVVMGGLSMLMPKLMENLDDEAKEELKNSTFAKSQAQANNFDVVGSLSSAAASWSAPSDDTPALTPSTKATKSKKRR